MTTVHFRNQTLTFKAFDRIVINTVSRGGLTNAYVVATTLNVRHIASRTRQNIAASLERLTAAGRLERVDLNVTGAAPAYRRVL